MDYTKVPQEINNIVEDNVKLLGQLFPSVVKDGQVDFEALKEELGQFEEVGKEKYELTWAGKQDAKKKAQEGVYNRTLKYIEEDSKNPDITENLYIEGDNLEVLKLLHENYYGAIKMIYIDPPYNTDGDFVYNDKFKMSTEESDIAEGTRDDEGNPLQKNPKSSNRYHANWLNMMYPRLRAAKDLLTNDGVIFISIDDNEVAQLRKICDEVFGEENFVTEFIWEKKKKPSFLHRNVGKLNDYIICYTKNTYASHAFSVETTTEGKKYPFNNAGNGLATLTFPAGYVKFGISDGKVEPQDMSEGAILTRLLDTIYIKDGVNSSSFRLEGEWRYSQAKLNDIVENGEGIVISKIPFRPNHIKAGGDVKKMKNFLSPTHYQMETNEDATSQLIELFGVDLFDNPKPIKLINYLTRAVTYNSRDSIILDFFSGSATTAHAVMQLNAEDEGNRKYIMVQLPEETDEKSEAYKAGYKNICEIGKERIRRAGEKIKEEVETANAQLKIDEEPKQVPDIGFKVFRTGDTNIKWNLYDELGQFDISTMTYTPDLADFTEGFNDIDVVYEVMIRQKDVPLSSTLETLTDIGSRTYLYGSTYLVCLETEITEELIDKLAALDPLPIKFIFRDSAFKDDINLKDETFRRLKTLIERNSGLEKRSYTVEFI